MFSAATKTDGASSAAVYVEEVFSTTLYTGNGLHTAVNANVPLGRFPTVYQENYTSAINTAISTAVNDWVIVYVGRAGAAPTCTINSASVAASSTLTDSAGYQYGVFISSTNSSTTTITSSSLNFAMVLVVRGPSGVSVATSLTQVSGTSFFTSSVPSTGWGMLFLTDRDPAANPTINVDNGTFMRTNIGPSTNGAIYGINGTGSSIPSRTISSLDSSTPTVYCVLSATGSGTTVATAGPTVAGGMVWIKSRALTYDHTLFDTVRGATNWFSTNLQDAQTTTPTSLTTFNSNGFSLGSYGPVNENTYPQVSWTFGVKQKFFTIVTYTGNGSNRAINHDLGSTPGMMIIRNVSASVQDTIVYHRTLGATGYLMLNKTDANTIASNVWNNTAPTSTQFTVGTLNAVNQNGQTFIAYLFAHDAGGFGLTGSDNVISCGSFSANANTSVNLGWEPQFILFKNSQGLNNWGIVDNVRGVDSSGTVALLTPNSSSAESSSASTLRLNSTGFTWIPSVSGNNYVYIAVRRGPMRTPTSASRVFQPVVYTGTNVDNRLVNTGTFTDMILARQRNSTTVDGMVVGDRLRGNQYLLTGDTSLGVTDADSLMTPTTGYGNAFSAMNGFGCGNDATAQLNISTVANNQIVEAFARAPGFFDIVTYTGTGVARTISHNLSSAPQMMWVKITGTSTQNWAVYSPAISARKYLRLSTTSAQLNDPSIWNSTAPTSSVFSVGTASETNSSGNPYVAYLFGSLPGVSKSSYYIGRGVGSSHSIDCGFASGARLVIIKSAQSSGLWYLYDSARGIIAGNDPYLTLESTTAEVTTTDYIDSTASGFEISTTAPANLNEGYGETYTAYVAGGSTINEGIYVNGQFVAVDTGGDFLTSSDGEIWAQTATTASDLRGVTFGNGLYVAAGPNGQITTSPNGATWTSRTSGTALNLFSCEYAFGNYWVVGQTGTLLKSSDGISWSPVSTGTTATLNRVKFLNGLLTIVGNSGVYIRSSDGINFTTSTIAGTGLNDIAFGNGLYVIGGNSSTALTSPDGITWTLRSPPAAITALTYASYRFIAGSTSGSTLYSNDGITWTSGPGVTAVTFAAAAYGNDIGILFNSQSCVTSPRYVYLAIA